MPKLIHNVTVELFSKDGDASALDSWVPIPIKTVMQEQWHWHPDREKTQVYELPKLGVSLWAQETPGDSGPITVFHYRFSKQRDTKVFAEKLQQISSEQREKILSNLHKYLDAKGRLLLRLDLQKPNIVEKGECLFLKVNLAAYPKNDEKCREMATEVLS